jgi:hypothetical protein
MFGSRNCHGLPAQTAATGKLTQGIDGPLCVGSFAAALFAVCARLAETSG